MDRGRNRRWRAAGSLPKGSVTLRNATHPVLRELLIPSHCVNEYAVVRLGVEDLEREVCNQPAPSSSGRMLSMKRESRSQPCGDLDFCAEAGAEAFVDGFVVGGLSKHSDRASRVKRARFKVQCDALPQRHLRRRRSRLHSAHGPLHDARSPGPKRLQPPPTATREVIQAAVPRGENARRQASCELVRRVRQRDLASSISQGRSDDKRRGAEGAAMPGRSTSGRNA